MKSKRNATSFVATPVAERFAASVTPEPNTGCHIWLGSIDSDGYGRIFDGSKTRKAHRLAFELATGRRPPSDLAVCHACDNRWCVNPAHLHLGTSAENTRERDLRGRTARGERMGAAVLTEAAVADARRRVAAGETRADLAREHGVSWTAMDLAVRGKAWSFLKAAVVTLLILALPARAQDAAPPADAPKNEARPAVMVKEGAPVPFDGVLLDDAQAVLIGKRMARCEAEMQLVETKVLVDKPVLIAGVVAVVVVVGGAFAAGYALAAAKQR